MRRQSTAFAILVGGAVAGTCDITYAIVFSGFRGVPATRILQSVSSGLLGATAYKGGFPTAALGLFLHYVIAFSAAALFCLANIRLRFLDRRPVIHGLLYGAIIYGVMNLIVLPLSAFPHKVKFPPLVLATGLFVHMFFIGLPISLFSASRNSAVSDPKRT